MGATTEYITSTEEENAALRKGACNAVATLTRVRARYLEMREACAKFTEVAEQRERALERQVVQLRLELGRREGGKFAAARNTEERSVSMSKDREEAEAESAADIIALQDEVEKFREESFQAKRELELCRTEYNCYRSVVLKDRASIKESREVMKQMLEQKILNLSRLVSSCEGKSDCCDELRTTREQCDKVYRQTEEMRLKLLEMRDEMEELRRERDQVTITLQNNLSTRQTGIVEAGKRIASLEIYVKILEGQLRVLEEECSRIRTHLVEQERHVLKTTDENGKLRNDLADKENKVFVLKERMEHDGVRLKNMLCVETNKYKQITLFQQEKLQTLHHNMQDLKATTDCILRANTKVMSTGESESKWAVQQLQKKNEDMENEIHSLRDTIKKVQLEHTCELNRATVSIRDSQSKSSRLVHKMEALTSSAMAAHESAEKWKNTARVTEHELQQCTKMEAEVTEGAEHAAIELKDMRHTNKQLRSRLGEVLDEVAVLTSCLNQERGRVAEEHAKESEKVEKRFWAHLKELAAKLANERRRGDAYKEKALLAHRSARNIHRALSQEIYSLNNGK
eukprot:CAMPEP_0113303418 /NCGR_PEP_ID=MMETSP0010_2-20120614/3845_1 /TAXON_ID=216773 ORGANISM="Corethron hystrix, Strain 308" /NCGR_SAMPLE_ID=MMETSP0010_2 /ASSEMBLY_ACC=CAM_ASM_000155 /LENGTH=571 /DNA_ID=CAMNT_0000157417 /DNA_START=93 /DNA_END=1808 /DNA_ORIENTATION=- /assembly_acc=CAM_ASM_000155